MTLHGAIQGVLTNPVFLGVWGVLVFSSLATLVADLLVNNQALGSLMQVVWVFTVLYSGSLGNLNVALTTFTFAYVFGYAMTVGPLLQEGVPFEEAMRDAFYTETPSITVMETVAIGTDLWLAGEAVMTDVLFWSALVFSLSLGLLAAYPVNVLLIHVGVKEGMMNPAEMA